MQTISYFYATDFSQFTNIITAAVIAVLSVAACLLAYKVLNAVPVKWLCDYDEEPSERHFGIRYRFKQSGIYTSALFAVLNICCFGYFGVSVYSAFIFAISFVLLLITLSDAKYTIIPDQFVIILGVICVAFAVMDIFCAKRFVSSWTDIILGAVCGGGTLLLINLLSKLVFKKDGMGFGDVKLMLALGACLGFPRVFFALLTSIAAAFVYIIFIVAKKSLKKDENSNYFPFGPFLCIGSLCNLIFAVLFDSLAAWYLSLIGF